MTASVLNLRPETVLRRVSRIQIRIEDIRTIVEVNGQSITLGGHGLAVLDLFARPLPLSAALQQLQKNVGGAQDWMDLVNAIACLCDVGALVEESGHQHSLRQDSEGFGSARVQVRMLNDRSRTTALQQAVAAAVRPGDVVLDLGTGSGVLAVTAAQAGAGHVYAIEASGIGRLARRVFEANGLTERITLLEGWSTQLKLPRPADLLVSEIIGNEPLSERVLELTLDARKRLLKPDARLVPARIRVLGLPVTVPERIIGEHCFTADTLNRWRDWYGIEFGPLAECNPDSPHLILCSLTAQDARRCHPLGKPALLVEVDLANYQGYRIETRCTLQITRAGVLHGVLQYFDLDLARGRWLSTGPSAASEDCHWTNLVWVRHPPLPVCPGERLEVAYCFRGGAGEISLGSSHD